MMRRTLAAILLLWLPAEAAAPDPRAQVFVKALVEAINSKDAAKRKALNHPDSLRCTAARTL